MRSLATLGGVLVLIVLAIAWRISNTVDAGQKLDPNSGIVTLGIEPDLPVVKGGNGTTANPAISGNSTIPPGSTETGGSTHLPRGSESPSENPTNSGDVGNQSSLNSGTDPTPGDLPSSADPVPQAGTPEEIRYTVLEGDSLYRILLHAYGKATPELIEAVAAANDMDDPGELTPGQTLILPVVKGFETPSVEG
jgi:nucleoid-associated protein YgaU